MNPMSLMFVDPPQLTDEAAAEVLDFLFELTNAFENHYFEQLRRYYRSNELPHSEDWIPDFDDDLPTF
jgi:hypothetical protein